MHTASLLDISLQYDVPITVSYHVTCAELFVEVLRCLKFSQAIGAREVIGTAVLLYHQLLCGYASGNEKRRPYIQFQLRYNWG
jgi:hypothetical protein